MALTLQNEEVDTILSANAALAAALALTDRLNEINSAERSVGKVRFGLLPFLLLACTDLCHRNSS